MRKDLIFNTNPIETITENKFNSTIKKKSRKS